MVLLLSIVLVESAFFSLFPFFCRQRFHPENNLECLPTSTRFSRGACRLVGIVGNGSVTMPQREAFYRVKLWPWSCMYNKHDGMILPLVNCMYVLNLLKSRKYCWHSHSKPHHLG